MENGGDGENGVVKIKACYSIKIMNVKNAIL